MFRMKGWSVYHVINRICHLICVPLNSQPLGRLEVTVQSSSGGIKLHIYKSPIYQCLVNIHSKANYNLR